MPATQPSPTSPPEAGNAPPLIPMSEQRPDPPPLSAAMANGQSGPERILMKPASEPLPWLGWNIFDPEGGDKRLGVHVPQWAVDVVHLVIWVMMKGKGQVGPLIAIVTQYVMDPIFALMTGSYYPLGGSKHLPIGFINNTDPTFGVPLLDGKPLYNPAAFPFDSKDADKNGFHEWVVHFLSLTIKASYESPELIQAIVAREWPGFEYVEHFDTDRHKDVNAAKLHALKGGMKPASPTEKVVNQVSADLIPETHAFLIKNKKALVVFFRGTEPSKLAEWWTDANMDPSADSGPKKIVNIEGRVHQGFYDALFYPLVHTPGSDESIFNRICTRLYEELQVPGQEDLKIYITGHSLGGALTSVFAHTLAHPKSNPNEPNGLPPSIGFDYTDELFDQVEGVVTWAGPLAGNHDYANFMIKNYEGKVFRMVHSSDVVTKLPAGLGYYHHPQEYFIAYNGSMNSDPQSIEQWRVWEGDYFDIYYLKKLLYGWTIFSPKGVPSGVFYMSDDVAWFMRNLARTFLRIMFYLLGFIIPGHSASGATDHWPSDYERKVRMAALDLGIYKKAVQEGRPTSDLKTTNMARTHS